MNTTWISRNATELQFKGKSSIGQMEHDGPACYWKKRGKNLGWAVGKQMRLEISCIECNT